MFLSSLRSAVKRYRYRAPKTSPHRFGAVKRFHTSKFVLNAQQQPKLKILFGTQTGTATILAEELAKQGRTYNFETQVIDLQEYNPPELYDEEAVVFVLSCFGKGEPTDNAKAFYEWLMNIHTDGTTTPLKGVKYAIFGLGSSAYGCERYQAVGKAVDKKLQELGARPICERGEGDDAKSIEDDFEAWQPLFWEAAIKEFNAGQSDAAQKIIDESVAKATEKPHLIWWDAQTPIPKAVQYYKQFDPAVHDMRNPLRSKVLAAEQLHSPASGRNCKHIEFDISNTDIMYQHGDYLGVYPKNDIILVEKLAKYCGFDLDAHFSLSDAGLSELAPKIPHFFANPCTVRDALLSYCDLTKPPRRTMLKKMAEMAKDEEDKKRLLQLATSDPSGRSRTLFEKAVYYKNMLQLLAEFPSVELSFENILELTPALQCRYYSISSSPHVSPQSIHLTVVRHMFQSPFDEHPAFGLCSSYLTSRKPGDYVDIFVKPSVFKLPEDPNVPIIMVGAGTGLAPFRGFLQERECQLKQRGSVGRTKLYFGCMDRTKDYIYANELHRWRDMGLLELDTAFSHENPNQLVFVQHLLVRDSEIIWDLIHNKKASFYVCGSKPMGDGVHEALIEIAKKEGGMTEKDAKDYLSELFNQHKYQADVFE